MTKPRSLLRKIKPGLQFSVCVGSDVDDLCIVTVRQVTPSQALLESSGDLMGWHSLDFVAGAISEASCRQCLRREC